jgi:hypothetical protein
MDAYDAMFSATYVLNERIAQQVFEVMPEGGPLLALVDGSGHYWASDSEAFMQLNLVETLLDDLRAQVDDGLDPAMVQVGDTNVMVTQLHTERTNCGYLVLAVPRDDADMTQTSLDLVEVLLSQILLVANLIERCGLLSDTQAKCYSAYATSDARVN